jgi:hypothetical protein
VPEYPAHQYSESLTPGSVPLSSFHGVRFVEDASSKAKQSKAKHAGIDSFSVTNSIRLDRWMDEETTTKKRQRISHNPTDSQQVEAMDQARKPGIHQSEHKEIIEKPWPPKQIKIRFLMRVIISTDRLTD